MTMSQYKVRFQEHSRYATIILPFEEEQILLCVRIETFVEDGHICSGDFRSVILGHY